MTSRHWLYEALAGAFFSMAVAAAVAAPQVVGDEACARYAVDIESFATCEDGKVVRAEAAPASAVTPVTHAALRVVGDEACARYAVDIESFATCEGGRVVRPEAEAIADIPVAPAAAHRDAVSPTGRPEGEHRSARRAGAPANPFAPDARHREAWLLVAAAPAGRPTSCDDGMPAPMAVAQRR